MSTSYHEFVIQGPRDWLLGFLHGYLEARGRKERLLDGEHEGFDCEPLRERLRELLHLGAETSHLLVPDAVAEHVREAIRTAASAEHPVRLVGEEPVRCVRFRFSFAIYSKTHAERIRTYFRDLPEGARVEADFKTVEDPSAKGVEAYAPVHDFEFEGEGTVEGTVDGVVEVYRKCRNEELIQEGKIEIVHGTPTGDEP